MEHGIEYLRKKTSRATDRIRIHEKGAVQWLSFPILDEEKWLVNAYSTRLGGVSEGDVSSMNLGFTREPDPENVRENFRRMADAAGFSADQMIFTRQTHTSRVMVAGKEHLGCGFSRERTYDNVDGLVTDVPGAVLVVFTADCVPVFLADPVKRAVGAIHSGWRGTVADIEGEAVRIMKEAFNSSPSDLIAAIGPSICMDCYEVDEDVIARFRQAFPENLHQQLFYAKPDGKYQLDLWEACRQNLLQAGLQAEKISMPDLCTACNSSLLFSHRASKGKRGSLAGFISVK